MSALHRNALLPDEDMCIRCGAKVQLPADYCNACVVARHPQVLYPDQLGERVDLYDHLATVEHYEKLARQARRKVKARELIGYAVMVLVAVAIGIMLAVGHS